MRLAVIVVLILAGCSKNPDVPAGKAVYEPKSGAFSLQGPADWRVMEDQGGAHRVTFFGPLPAVESIAVYRYEKGPVYSSAGAYLAGLSLAGRSSPVLEVEISGRKWLELRSERTSPAMHGGRQEKLEVRTAVLEDASGFWSLVHTAPAGKASKAVFDELLKTFKAKPGK
jgi:hypothetical protein